MVVRGVENSKGHDWKWARRSNSRRLRFSLWLREEPVQREVDAILTLCFPLNTPFFEIHRRRLTKWVGHDANGPDNCSDLVSLKWATK